MGWQLEAFNAVTHPKDGAFVLSASNDGETWQDIQGMSRGTNAPVSWQQFARYALPEVSSQRQHIAASLQAVSLVPLLSHCRVADQCIARARYFRLSPDSNGAEPSRQIRFGLLVLDDHADHLETRRVRGLSPLHLAAKMGNTELIEKLLDHGADIELLADCWKPVDGGFSAGKTPLELAASSASLEAVRMLTDRGAKVDEHSFMVPKGKTGDLVAGFLQTNGSKPVTRTSA